MPRLTCCRCSQKNRMQRPVTWVTDSHFKMEFVCVSELITRNWARGAIKIRQHWTIQIHNKMPECTDLHRPLYFPSHLMEHAYFTESYAATDSFCLTICSLLSVDSDAPVLQRNVYKGIGLVLVCCNRDTGTSKGITQSLVSGILLLALREAWRYDSPIPP